MTLHTPAGAPDTLSPTREGSDSGSSQTAVAGTTPRPAVPRRWLVFKKMLPALPEHEVKHVETILILYVFWMMDRILFAEAVAERGVVLLQRKPDLLAATSRRRSNGKDLRTLRQRNWALCLRIINALSVQGPLSKTKLAEAIGHRSIEPELDFLAAAGFIKIGRGSRGPEFNITNFATQRSSPMADYLRTYIVAELLKLSWLDQMPRLSAVLRELASRLARDNKCSPIERLRDLELSNRALVDILEPYARNPLPHSGPDT